eukprot:4760937-Karenia_brevis.AAC.1
MENGLNVTNTEVFNLKNQMAELRTEVDEIKKSRRITLSDMPIFSSSANRQLGSSIAASSDGGRSNKSEQYILRFTGWDPFTKSTEILADVKTILDKAEF